MERNGIGTDASIPTHIENILKRNYVTLISGRRLKPSKLGIVLAQGYMHIDPSLVLPEVRAEIEAQCTRIAKGEATLEVRTATLHNRQTCSCKLNIFPLAVHPQTVVDTALSMFESK